MDFPSERMPSALVWAAAGSGVILSAASLLGICSDACRETTRFLLCGIPFGWFGVVFFAVVAVVHLFRGLKPAARALVPLLLFGAVGAEVRFVYIQHHVIGRFCPLCLSIAAVVVVGAAAAAYQTRGRGTMTQGFFRRLALIAAAVAGFAAATFGVGTESVAAPDYFLGRDRSPVTVYFVSDWFCPACRKVEPKVAEIAPRLLPKVRVAFVDYPVHPETSNFTPYNLQFLAYEKGKYLALRDALAGLSRKTKTPSAEEVGAAVAPLGVKLRQMNYADILYGLQADLATYRGYGVKGTPSVVIASSATKKHRVLEGERGISLAAIEAAIAEVSK